MLNMQKKKIKIVAWLGQVSAIQALPSLDKELCSGMSWVLELNPQNSDIYCLMLRDKVSSDEYFKYFLCQLKTFVTNLFQILFSKFSEGFK